MIMNIINPFLLVISYEQADTSASSQGSMFQSVLKTCCEIIEFGWSRDRAPLDTFIMGLATSIRERNDYEEEVSILYYYFKLVTVSFVIRFKTFYLIIH